MNEDWEYAPNIQFEYHFENEAVHQQIFSNIKYMDIRETKSNRTQPMRIIKLKDGVQRELDEITNNDNFLPDIPFVQRNKDKYWTFINVLKSIQHYHLSANGKIRFYWTASTISVNDGIWKCIPSNKFMIENYIHITYANGIPAFIGPYGHTQKTECIIPIWYKREAKGIDNIAMDIHYDTGVMKQAFEELIQKCIEFHAMVENWKLKQEQMDDSTEGDDVDMLPS